jgi:hypothetical protein
VGKPEGERPLGRIGRRREDIVIVDLSDTDWINLAQDRDSGGLL